MTVGQKLNAPPRNSELRSEVDMALFRNKKNGNLYFALGTVTNATNAQDDQEMVLYRPVKSERLFCREQEEFNQKFEGVDADEVVDLLGPMKSNS